MKKLIKELEKERRYYNSIARKAAESLQGAPEGCSLRVDNSKSTPQYYLITEKGDHHGKYIPKKDREIARQIAQRDYDKVVMTLADKCLNMLDQFLLKYPVDEIKKLHLKLPHLKASYQCRALNNKEIRETACESFERKSFGRTKLITPYELSDEEYTCQWESVTYEGRVFEPNAPEIITNRGERVRSKSEKIIADKLYEMRIPYRYEYPVHIKGYGTIYPDFTVLNVTERKEWILEHLGKLDDPGYISRNTRKLRSYERNGYIQGVNLLITWETKDNPLDTRSLVKLLTCYFI
ncbi:MAG TPA: hypothetical protein VJY54_10060 [Lachnospiraceae bacterium]|nr:hypothetical protein [Lachnospiraceae bacterium]